MKIKAWIILIAIFLVVGISAFFPVNIIHTITITSNFDNTYQHVSNLNEWEHWNPAIKKINNGSKKFDQNNNQKISFRHADDSISVTKITPFSYFVFGIINKKSVSYNLNIIPSSSTNKLDVGTLERTKFFNYIFRSADSTNGEKTLAALKEFLENTKNTYGFNIKSEIVTDTVFAVCALSVDSNKLFNILPKKFKLIEDYIEQHHLEKKGSYSVSYTPEKDSLHLILGIPVNIFSEASGIVHCVNIPKGKMLTGFYDGKVLNKYTIYSAFIRYAADNHLENVGASFESYINDKLPASDTSTVQFKFHYPIL